MKTAFDKWLAQASANDAEMAAQILVKLLLNNPASNNIVWYLCEQTGDIQYTPETFLKVAKTCLEKKTA